MNKQFKFSYLKYAVFFILFFSYLFSKDFQFLKSTNSEFGFTYFYPSGFFPQQGLTVTKDKQQFSSDDKKIQLSIWGAKVLMPDDFKKNYKNSINEYGETKVEFKLFKRKWYIISGFDGDNVFFRKSVFNKKQGYIKTFTIIYPKGEEKYKEASAAISKKFK